MNETLRQKCHPYSILTSRLKYEWLVYWVFFFYSSIGIFSLNGFWIVTSIASIKSLMQQPCLIWCNGTKFILNEALLHESIHFFYFSFIQFMEFLSHTYREKSSQVGIWSILKLILSKKPIFWARTILGCQSWPMELLETPWHRHT